jgi:hypothetical protein
MTVADISRIDARPIRPTSTDTAWDRAIARRDELAASVRHTLEQEKVEALVLISADGNYPPWVKLEAWLPPRQTERPGSARERAELVLVVDAKPFRKRDLTVSAHAVRGNRRIDAANRPQFTAGNAADWTRYTLGRAGKPSNYHPFLDFLQALIASFLPIVPRPHRNPVAKPFKNFLGLGGIGVLMLVSIAAIVAGVVGSRGPTFGPIRLLAPLGVVGLIAAAILERRRRHSIYLTPQPSVPPSNLGHVDSWHAALAELGRDYEGIKQRLSQRLMEERSAGLDIRAEHYGYRTPNGYEERERLVVSKGQGVVHVHIYPFGEDLFVGWNAYLNWAKWDETSAVSSRAKAGETIEFRGLQAGFYVPNQFDLIDLNSLSELVHRRIERELKAILKERAIDQEIDFRIIRGDRDSALDRSKHEKSANPSGGWR